MSISTSEPEKAKPRKGGRNEVLTLDLAQKIVKLIETMPDVGIPVTWASIEVHVKKRFGQPLKRNALSTKKWSGRALIHDAYEEAGRVQSQMHKQGTPKYSNSSRAVLLAQVGKLEARLLALKAELESVRSLQYDKLDLYRTTRTDLRALVEDQLHGVNK